MKERGPKPSELQRSADTGCDLQQNGLDLVLAPAILGFQYLVEQVQLLLRHVNILLNSPTVIVEFLHGYLLK